MWATLTRQVPRHVDKILECASSDGTLNCEYNQRYCNHNAYHYDKRWLTGTKCGQSVSYGIVLQQCCDRCTRTCVGGVCMSRAGFSVLCVAYWQSNGACVSNLHRIPVTGCSSLGLYQSIRLPLLTGQICHHR